MATPTTKNSIHRYFIVPLGVGHTGGVGGGGGGGVVGQCGLYDQITAVMFA